MTQENKSDFFLFLQGVILEIESSGQKPRSVSEMLVNVKNCRDFRVTVQRPCTGFVRILASILS